MELLSLCTLFDSFYHCHKLLYTQLKAILIEWYVNNYICLFFVYTAKLFCMDYIFGTDTDDENNDKVGRTIAVLITEALYNQTTFIVNFFFLTYYIISQ